MSKPKNNTPRKPATKFAHLRKKMGRRGGLVKWDHARMAFWNYEFDSRTLHSKKGKV